MVTPAASFRKAVTVLSALALLPRFPAPGPAAALHSGLGSGLEDFVHRDYGALFGAIPAVALGSLAVFALRDRAAWAGEGAAPGPAAAAVPTAAAATGAARTGPGLRPDEELALAGVVLAVMADRLEHDPAAYPLLACAAARMVAAGPAGALWTGLTERARRAAVEVLRPTALRALVRAVTWSLATDLERL
jgi:hypothetical protein